MENVILNYADIKQHLAIFGIARLEIDDSSLPISLVRLLIVYVISFRGCKRRWRDFWNDTFGNNRTSRISMIFLFQSGKKKEREREKERFNTLENLWRSRVLFRKYFGILRLVW